MNKYKIVPTGRFKQDLRIARKRGYNLALLATVVDTLLKDINF